MKKLIVLSILCILVALLSSPAWCADTKISALSELELYAIDDEIAVHDKDAGSTKKIQVGNLVLPVYVVDSAESDQGVTGNGRTVKALSDTIGSNNAILAFINHGSASTSHNFDTSLDLGTKSNLYFYFQPGAYLDQVTGDETLTVYDRSHVIRPLTSKISDGNVLVYNNLSTTNVGNVGSGEDTLMSRTYLANSLEASGAAVRIIAWGYTAANANNKTLKLYLGSTAIYNSTATAANDKTWHLEAVVMRTGTATEKYTIVSGTWNGSALICTRGTAAETLTSNVTIKCTGEATDDNDIVQEGLLFEDIK